MARAVRSRQPAQIDDVQSEAGYPWPDARFRTALARARTLYNEGRCEAATSE